MSVQHTPGRRLTDHRACGGGGCKGCNHTGTKMVAVLHPVGLMPADEAAFEVARYSCSCYQGISVNEGVAQCVHADHRRGGEWCRLDDCPAIASTTEATAEPAHELAGYAKLRMREALRKVREGGLDPSPEQKRDQMTAIALAEMAIARLAARGTQKADAVGDGEPPFNATSWLTNGAELHPLTKNLVVRFARALAAKLAAAEKKYGYTDGWRSPDWMDECRAHLMEHINKGDPRDVAAYCAFLWHHGASTTPLSPAQSPAESHSDTLLLNFMQEFAEAARAAGINECSFSVKTFFPVRDQLHADRKKLDAAMARDFDLSPPEPSTPPKAAQAVPLRNARPLSDAISEFLRTNTPPHISSMAWRPERSEAPDAWEIQLNYGSHEERADLMKLVDAFVLGWRECDSSKAASPQVAKP